MAEGSLFEREMWNVLCILVVLKHWHGPLKLSVLIFAWITLNGSFRRKGGKQSVASLAWKERKSNPWRIQTHCFLDQRATSFMGLGSLLPQLWYEELRYSPECCENSSKWGVPSPFLSQISFIWKQRNSGHLGKTPDIWGCPETEGDSWSFRN